MKRRVVKVGGSLLEQPHLKKQLDEWLALHSDMQNVLVVGGGRVADLVRANDGFLSDSISHQLACSAMSFTANLVSDLLGFGATANDLEWVIQSNLPNVVFDSCDWVLSQKEVPESWSFTSDSIAARLATTLNAEELVLIKSRMGTLDEPGFVDECFAEASKSLKAVRICKLDHPE